MLKSCIKSYLQSFRWRKDLWKPFIIDSIALPVIVFLWLGLGKFLTRIAYSLSQGKSVEELKIALLSSPETARAFVSNMKYFIIALIGWSLLAVILSVIIFSLAQELIWSVKFEKKKLGKWVKLNLVLLGIFILFAAAYLGFNLLLNFIIASTIIKGLINSLLLLIFIFFWFIASHSFARTYRILESISYTFSTARQKFRYYFCAFIMVYLTGILLSLLISLLKKQFYWQILGWPNGLALSLELIILLLYLAWIRFYVSRI